MTSPKTLPTSSQTKLPSQYVPLENAYMTGISGFDPKTADLTALQNMGLNYASGLNMTGMNEADALNTRQIQGEFLNGNPYLDTVLQKQNEAITKQYQQGVGSIDSTTARSGIFGGSVWKDNQDTAQENYIQGLADNTNKTMMANYESERANQINSMNNAGGLFGSQVSNSQGLFGLGANEQSYDQLVADEELRSKLSEEQIRECFNYDYYTKNVDNVFARVFKKPCFQY
jgi:hypothetical protein